MIHLSRMISMDAQLLHFPRAHPAQRDPAVLQGQLCAVGPWARTFIPLTLPHSPIMGTRCRVNTSHSLVPASSTFPTLACD